MDYQDDIELVGGKGCAEFYEGSIAEFRGQRIVARSPCMGPTCLCDGWDLPGWSLLLANGVRLIHAKPRSIVLKDQNGKVVKA